MNRIAVLNIVFIPVLINPAISSRPNPASTAAISGSKINASGGAIFSLINTNIRMIISANPINANISLPPIVFYFICCIRQNQSNEYSFTSLTTSIILPSRASMIPTTLSANCTGSGSPVMA